MILVVDDDRVMAECIARACGGGAEIVGNAIDAMVMIEEKGVPELIFLDVLLDGPDGFTLLDELASYADTAKIPVVLVTSLDLTKQDLSAYGVVGVLDKALMTPREVRRYAEKYAS